jgi:endogenous inhibitor of DNA gyrase (YacG/DUF329 family)
MTFARVTGCQEEDEPGSLYATREGVSTETFVAGSRSACKIAALTRFATGGYDACTMPSEPDPSAADEAAVRYGRCPACARATSWTGNPQRPFCSLICRLINLGVWLDQGYAVPDGAPDDVR